MTERERAELRDRVARARVQSRPAAAPKPPRRKPRPRRSREPADAYLEELCGCLVDLDRVVHELAAHLARMRQTVEHDRSARGWLEAEREVVRLRRRLAEVEVPAA